MANISVNLNLLGYEGAVKKVSAKGATYIAIPLIGNNIYEGEKGCYSKLVGVEMTTVKEGKKDTHILKQDGTKEENRPIIGNCIYWGKTGTTAPVAKTDTVQNTAPVSSDIDELPW